MDGKLDNVALFDMDGTICDYELGLFNALEKLRSPNEKSFRGYIGKNTPQYIRRRANLIRNSEEWWVSLPKFNLGWNVLEIAKELQYRIMILTQGPTRISAAWSGKKKWIDEHLGDSVDVTITRDKGLVYGRVLVDDYPDYIDGWLKWRKNGLVIMPASDANSDYRHNQVIRYDGKNLEQVKDAMKKAKRI